ncbi:hypothetical protein HDU98_007473 [Podochytrium sp. JEL0797]|nr:hypothetical protein HDU98_007473 [Podochytrium sp. JEL0797]
MLKRQLQNPVQPSLAPPLPPWKRDRKSAILAALDLQILLTKLEHHIQGVSIDPDNATLLFRASESGFNSVHFLAALEGKGNTMLLVKLKGSKIIGGYSDAVWTDPEPRPAKMIPGSESLLFSRERCKATGKIEYILHPCLKPENGVMFSSHFGCVMGAMDLVVGGKECRSWLGWKGSAYSMQLSRSEFLGVETVKEKDLCAIAEVVEFEVFQLH